MPVHPIRVVVYSNDFVTLQYKSISFQCDVRLKYSVMSDDVTAGCVGGNFKQFSLTSSPFPKIFGPSPLQLIKTILILDILYILDGSLNSIDKHIDRNIQIRSRIRFMVFIIINFFHLVQNHVHMFISSNIYDISIIISCIFSIIIGWKVKFIVSKTLNRIGIS